MNLLSGNEAIARGASAINPGATEWLGMLLVCIVLPAILTWLFGLFFRKIGWIKDGDLKLDT